MSEDSCKEERPAQKARSLSLILQCPHGNIWRTCPDMTLWNNHHGGKGRGCLKSVLETLPHARADRDGSGAVVWHFVKAVNSDSAPAHPAQPRNHALPTPEKTQVNRRSPDPCPYTPPLRFTNPKGTLFIYGEAHGDS